MSTMPEIAGEAILGVDTHEREHVAALIDELGRLLATRSFATNVCGCRQLLAWARERGPVIRAGVEGTGSFGAGLARLLAQEGVEVIEVTRPSRRGRRHLGKSDTVDAEAAARMVLSGEATAIPKRRGCCSSAPAASASGARFGCCGVANARCQWRSAYGSPPS